MARGETLKKGSAGEIGKRIMDLERASNDASQTGFAGGEYESYFATIDKNHTDGKYDLTEVTIDNINGGYDTLAGGNVWEKGDADNLKEAREINGNPNLAVGTIVIILSVLKIADGEIDWVIVATSSSGGTSIIKTDKSNTVVANKVQFVNDIVFDATVQGPPAINGQVGDVTYGPDAYGSTEDGDDTGIQRWYKHMWHANKLDISYLNPQDDQAYDGQGDKAKSNLRHIRFKVTDEGQVIQIRHASIPIAERSDPNLLHTYNGGTLATVFVAATSAGSPTVAVKVDNLGHLLDIGGTATGDDPYDPPVVGGAANSTQTLSGYPSSGTLYNIAMTQTANIQDGVPVDTNTFNGATALSYTATNEGGDPIDIGFTVSTSQTVPAAATKYNGAGTGGNNTAIKMNLSRQLDGKQITLDHKVVVPNVSASAKITVDKVYIVCEIKDTGTSNDATSIPDNADFDVWGYLLDGAGGARETRFDGLGEYRMSIYCYYANDGFDADTLLAPGGTGPGYLALEIVNVASFDTNSKSGGIVTFSIDFPATRAGDDLAAKVFVEFFATAANPQPQASQIGNCITANAGSNCEEVLPITGTAFTGAATLPKSSYSTAGGTIVRNGLAQNITYTVLDDPIVLTFAISPNTTAFSDISQDSTIRVLQSGVPVKFVVNGIIGMDTIVNELFQLKQISNTGAVDGFTITILELETAYVIDGSSFVVSVSTPGVSDSPNTTTFAFQNASAFPASDDFTGSGTNSGTTADSNFTDRWTESNTANASQAITSNNLVHTITANVATDTARSENKFSDGANPNITSSTWLASLQMSGIAFAGTGTEQQYVEATNASISMRMGYKDAGSGQKLFVYDGTSEVVTETSTATSGTPTIERGDFAVSDDFGGTGQDSVSTTSGTPGYGVFNSRWTTVGPGTSIISGSALDVSQTNSAPDETGIHQTFDSVLPDGFEIVSNWSNLVLSSTTTGYRSWTMRIGNVASGRFVQFYRSRDGGDNIDDLYANSTSEGATLIEANSSTSGEFKIVQSGNDFLLYLDSVLKDTVTDATLASSGVNNFRWEMQLGGNSGTSSATINDITITTDGTVELVQDRVLSSEGTTLKYAFDDSGADVTDIDIVTTTTHTTAYSAKYPSIVIESPTGTQFTFTP